MRRVVVVVLAGLAVVVGGVAAAYWTGAVAGLGSGRTGTAQPVVLTSATPTAGLYPGQRADAVLTATNPNPAAVLIPSLRLDTSRGTGGFAVDAGHPGCGTAALGFTTQTNGGTGWTVPGRQGADDGRLSVTLPNALTMATDAADACQGATFTVYLAAGP